MIKIGTNSFSYLEKRNFVDLPYKNIVFKKVFDFYKIKHFIWFRFFRKTDPNALYTFRDFSLNGVNLYHFFSVVMRGNKPWVVTSSVPLPRWTKNTSEGIKLLASDNCKKIIFLSEVAKKRQLHILESYPELAEAVSKKITVLHPAQPLLINSYSEKKLDDGYIHFTLVGHQILIKGGLEVLRVFERLHNEGLKVKLNLVSLLHTVPYLQNSYTAQAMAEVKEIIRKNNNYLNYYPSLPNNEVLKILKNSHVALLPSYGDTYGYSVLESQACGCPVISTDVMALPEINNNDIGWIFEVPKLEFGRPDVYSDEKYLEFSQKIENQLHKIITDIIRNPGLIKQKGEKAMAKIVDMHNPGSRAQYLEYLYHSILNKKTV